MEHGSFPSWRKGERLSHDPLRGTKISPVALDCKSSSTLLGTRQLHVMADTWRLCLKGVRSQERGFPELKYMGQKRNLQFGYIKKPI